jgi:hypothetical protein
MLPAICRNRLDAGFSADSDYDGRPAPGAECLTALSILILNEHISANALTDADYSSKVGMCPGFQNRVGLVVVMSHRRFRELIICGHPYAFNECFGVAPLSVMPSNLPLS